MTWNIGCDSCGHGAHAQVICDESREKVMKWNPEEEIQFREQES